MRALVEAIRSYVSATEGARAPKPWVLTSAGLISIGGLVVWTIMGLYVIVYHPLG